ncbi:DUF2254 domain-containing protein [Glacieibacterium sp.]|uniref:DUF2254 domain-containing protein n=1 Tax=Glacieibacterium sp. TaxID=2860237 RepID=UPI003B005498
MNARIRQFIGVLADTFWLVPAILVVFGISLALGLVALDRSGLVPQALIDSPWLYNGGGTGARTLLGAVASSTIGVAGTVFSITIAALSLAAGQMGPRLLRNFVSDRGNQFTLGAFLGTFSYALMVLRSVRTQDEGVFVPHVSLTVGILLAFVCVGTLVYFVGHMAGRINVDTVIELVSEDLRIAVETLTDAEPRSSVEWQELGDAAIAITDARRGYLQELDRERLADWAAAHTVRIELLVRPGDFVFPGSAIARAEPATDGIDAAIRRATALGGQRVSRVDLEYPVRQLVEIAVRALSAGINDPNTAISVLDRLGATLCDIVPRHLPTGIVCRDGVAVLRAPATDYDGLVDAMFNTIRQNAAGSPAVLIRLVEVLGAVASYEPEPGRIAALRRHAALVVADARRTIDAPADLADLLARQARSGLA